MSNTLDVINTRSSIRAFKAEMIDENLCRTLVEAGLKAPTATNRQEIHITVTTNDNPVNDKIQKDLNPNAEKSFYYHAPLVFYLSGEDGFGWTAIDAGIAVENIHLAAKELGLGSVILGCMDKVLNGEKKAEYAKLLAIPEGYSFKIAIAIGYPDTEKEPHTYDFEKNVTVL
ncbi:MAG: nitroreductase family protein [Erysipelotrichaceae bacterium]|nr:nitroreductase family protein [Erysipelotrichaceae bacterium]